MDSHSAPVSIVSILIVDDSPDNLRALSGTLVDYGYKVRCVTNGEMALTSIKHLPPDVILLDIRMPNLDGYDVAKRLKADPATQHIPIIFLSALDDLAGKVKAFQVGGADYITKPFQAEEVIARIKNQLTIQKLQKQLLAQNYRLQQEVEEHKQTEAALRQEIYERTLVELALKDAKEAAEAANYAKNEFLAKMNHELRTPLNAIIGFAELMRSDHALSEEYQEYLMTISNSGQHLLKVINQILRIVNVKSEAIALHEQSFDFSRFLDTIKVVWEQKAINKNLQFTVECQSDLPKYIYGDESKLRQIVVNLLENAIQFTQRGGVVLRVKSLAERLPFETEPSPTCCHDIQFPIHFEIQDTGSGIASHELNHLFQIFSQTESGQKSGRGIGLGLFISRQFVRLMGGDIAVESTPNQGTTVRFHVLVRLCGSPETSLSPVSTDDSLTPRLEPSEDEATTLLSVSVEDLVRSLCTVMPEAWFEALDEAAVKGFDRKILELLGEIPTAYSSLSIILATWTKDYQFDRITDLIQSQIHKTL